MNNILPYKIALSLLPNVGPKRFQVIYQYISDNKESYDLFWKKDFKEISLLLGNFIKKDIWESREIYFKKALKIIEKLKNYNINIVFFDEELYPSSLLELNDFPAFITYQGDVSLLENIRKVAIVGTRKNTYYGKQVTEKLVSELVNNSCVIVSGMAIGIDAIAHKVCLDNDGKTIAVLGTSLDVCYPEVNRKIYNLIKNNGLLISEFLPTTKPEAQNFPKRNRIIAAISDCIVIVESKLKGGAIITANYGLELGKEIFAVPGNIISDYSQGPNFLISQGANVIYRGVEDIIDNMGWIENSSLEKKNFLPENQIDKFIIDVLKNKSIVHIDEILRDENLVSLFSINEIMMRLTLLELDGIISKQPGNYYVANI